jgi:hypothetical protein
LSAHTSAAARGAAAREAAAELFVRALTAFFDPELDIVDRMRVGGNGSLELSRRLEVGECAVLRE